MASVSNAPVLGIDLGTTNSVVAIADGKEVRVLADDAGHRLVPSVVSFHPDGNVLVGDRARARRLIDAENTVYSVKRLIGRPFDTPEVKRAQERFAFTLKANARGGVVVEAREREYTLTEISALVLGEIRRVAKESVEQTCDRAVITVPANFNELQRSATKAAGRVAGLDVLRILNEPTAAALAYGCGKRQPEKVAVYDLGGGTFDITVLLLENDIFEVVSTAGDSFLGGDDFDVLIADAMSDVFLKQHRWDPRDDGQAYERLRAAAEWAKCELSKSENAALTVEELVHAERGKPLDLEFAMTRAEFEERARPVIERSFDVCGDAMSNAAARPHEIDTVILVGGSTRIPLVRQMVRDYFDCDPRTDIDPDLVVAQGAAIHAHALSSGRVKHRALGRIALKQKTRVEIEAARAARAARTAALPKQPAFAPTLQVEKAPPAPPPLPPPMPGGVSGHLADSPAALPDLPPPSRPPPPDPQGVLVTPAAIVVGDGAPNLNIPGIVWPEGPGSEPGAPGPGDNAAAPPPAPPAAPPAAPSAAPPPASAPGSFLDGDSPPSTTHNLPGLDLEALQSIPPPPAAPLSMAPPPSEIPQPAMVMPEQAPPILLDVTPHSLGLEVAGGYCQQIIRRNVPIPAEQTRVFTTARDDQEAAQVRVCQGESRSFEENQALGEVVLSGLRAAKRGEVKIEVVFVLDANGTLDVTARDVDTGTEQATRIDLLGGLTDEEIEAMRTRHDSLIL